MKIRTLLSTTAIASLLFAQSALASLTLFSDDFESGLGNWSLGVSGTVLTLDNTRDQAGGTSSAKLDISSDFMGHTITGDTLGSAISASVWIYDANTAANRVFMEVGNYSGGGWALGSKSQVLAAGKYSSNTKAGEPAYTATKYSGRVLYPSAIGGWFNLNGPGSPNASRPAWHKFTIERLADNTTINFYVDDILSRTIAGANAYTWNYIALGFGAGTTVGDAWLDNVSVVLVPEPSVAALGLLGGLGLLVARMRRR